MNVAARRNDVDVDENMDYFQTPECSARIDQLMTRHHVLGLGLALVQNGRIESKGFGQACLTPSRNFETDTLIPLGSSTKSLTAAAVAILVGDNETYPEVQYDATMQSLLPDDFVMAGDDHEDVTVEDLLCHRTGMPPHEFAMLGPTAEHPDDARSLTRNLRNLSPVSPREDKFIYCNMMYTVASYLVEAKSGQTFADFLERYILGPLDMDSTCLRRQRAKTKGLAARIATGYDYSAKNGEHSCVPYVDGAETQGAGNLFSTVDDYAKWIKAMIYREGPITKDIFQSLTTKRICQEEPEDGEDREQMPFYALGWEVQRYSDLTLLFHTGGEAGCSSAYFFVPELEFGGVIFSNSAHADVLINQLMYLFIDKAACEPMDAVPEHEQVPDDTDDDLQSHASTEDHTQDSGAANESLQNPELPHGVNGSLPPHLPLKAYVGEYWNPGYRRIVIGERSGRLFADCTNRSLGFTVTLEPTNEHTKFMAQISLAHDDIQYSLRAEFTVEGGKATKLGIQLEEMLEENIWFNRMEQ